MQERKGKATVVAIPSRRHAGKAVSRRPAELAESIGGNINSQPRGRQSVVACNTLARAMPPALGRFRPGSAGPDRQHCPALSVRDELSRRVFVVCARGNSYD